MGWDHAFVGVVQLVVFGGIWLIIELTWPLRPKGEVVKIFFPSVMLIVGIILTTFCMHKMGWIF